MKDVFLQMSVLLAWQKGADQKIYAGDSNVAPEALEIKKATCWWHNVKCASGKSSCKICPHMEQMSEEYRRGIRKAKSGDCLFPELD